MEVEVSEMMVPASDETATAVDAVYFNDVVELLPLFEL